MDVVGRLRALDAGITIDVSLDILNVFKEGCAGLKLVNPRLKARKRFYEG